ncbi:MAG: ACT domain-containing protein [Clostridiales bacterium]|jgi:ACT domain-containing protein|nr:ACT domain-containing protein [Clostridiales bacterium]
MRAVISVIGRDKKGIIAKVSGCLFDVNVNIEDISQTIMGDLFTMIMMVDLSESSADIGHVNDLLQKTATDMKVEIRLQNEEIFNSMHKI